MIRLITYLLFLPFSLTAQIDFQNVSLTKPDMQILYCEGLENRIQITGADGVHSLILTASEGTVNIIEENLFGVRLFPETSDTLKLYRNGKLILSKIYDSKKLGEFIAQLGSITTGRATIQEIIFNPVIHIVTIPESYYNHQFRVISFIAEMVTQSGDTIQSFEQGAGNRLTEEHFSAIKKLKIGQKLVLHHITATCPGCSLRRFPPIEIEIR